MSATSPGPAEIEAIERATIAAVAHEVHEVIGPWILGLRPGSIGRAHSAAPLTHTLVRDEGLIARIEAAYRVRSMSPVFRLPEVEGLSSHAEALTERGYVPTQPTQVMRADLARVAAVADPDEVVLLDRPDEAWASVFLGEGFDPEDGAQRVAVLSNSPGAVFAAVRDGEGTHAVGVLSLAEGWASLHGMRTRRDRRGQGLAGQVMARLAHAALERGATKAFLQVETGNAPALALYARAGFTPLWRYHYWRLA
ncbi:MAG: GNAT family N-acetyltransferase [Phenylobacterium sp.]|uniref:GNAT family N-acetyltransferase n=1 Tax=Phenylobacterium sp. TaxID=1871053 RepID=UPI0027335DA5|nr:GNAT family N-acetyltransferase [Phenylobacterium sp.]MDP1641965.1 GNAT family N-acetyltransferase [Phenylobacterium sp.]MDP3116012.1 GNAT family N-acetyltransferase [Phenylobacterium sp.]